MEHVCFLVRAGYVPLLFSAMRTGLLGAGLVGCVAALVDVADG